LRGLVELLVRCFEVVKVFAEVGGLFCHISDDEKVGVNGGFYNGEVICEGGYFLLECRYYCELGGPYMII